MKVMAIDLGDVRTGVAFSDLTGFLAGHCYTITPKGRTELIEKLCEAIATEKPGKVVLGLPINMNGTEGPRAQKCRDFAALLEEACGMPVELWDERSSTVTASHILSDAGNAQKVTPADGSTLFENVKAALGLAGAEQIALPCLQCLLQLLLGITAQAAAGVEIGAGKHGEENGGDEQHGEGHHFPPQFSNHSSTSRQ